MSLPEINLPQPDAAAKEFLKGLRWHKDPVDRIQAEFSGPVSQSLGTYLGSFGSTVKLDRGEAKILIVYGKSAISRLVADADIDFTGKKDYVRQARGLIL